VAKNTKNSYFGLYFSGSTISRSGDWAVLSDDQSEIDFISITAIHERLQKARYRGQIWISMDGPSGGRWVSQFALESKNMGDVFTNVLIDSCTDNFGRSEWLCYITRLVDPEQTLWVQNRPHAYNMHFPCVVWPNQARTNIPQYSVFRWLDSKTNEKVDIDTEWQLLLED
jgi:hypothetical protein